MAQDAGVDILNTFKKNRKDFFGKKMPKCQSVSSIKKLTKIITH